MGGGRRKGENEKARQEERESTHKEHLYPLKGTIPATCFNHSRKQRYIWDI